MNEKLITTMAVVFSDESQVTKMTLADGYRFVALARGSEPQIIEVDGPGIYEIYFSTNLGEWPIVVFAIDAAHKLAWTKLTAAQVDNLINSLPAREVNAP